MSRESTIRIFLTDDHQVVLDTLQVLLQDSQDLEIVGFAKNGQDLLGQLEQIDSEGTPIDLILMDISMPVMDGLEATRQVKLKYPSIKILILTSFTNEDVVKQALAFGADGYITKHQGKQEFLDAIYKVCQGEQVLHDDKDPSSETFPAFQVEKPPLLTRREKQIICLLAKSSKLEEISQQLSLSLPTVTTLRKNILVKLKVQTDEAIVRWAMIHELC